MDVPGSGGGVSGVWEWVWGGEGRGVVHEIVGWGEGRVDWLVDVEGVEGGFGGVGDGKAGCVERGGHVGDVWQG